MKKIYFFFILFYACQLGQTQTDTTVQITTEVGDLDQQHIIPIKNCFLCVQGDVKRAFKFGYNNISAYHQPVANYFSSTAYFPSFLFGFEQRIVKGFSVNTKIEWSNLMRKNALMENIARDGIPLYQYNSEAFKNTSLSIEPRWYFLKKQQIKERKSGNNLNGTYIGLQLSQNWWENGKYITYEETPVNGSYKQKHFNHTGQNQIALLNFGWQHRFYDNGFVNFKLGTGISRNTQNLQSLSVINGEGVPISALSKWKWLLNYQVTWGSVFGKKNKVDMPVDNFIEYYEEAKDMWKIDLFNIFQGLNETGAIGRLNIAYERKINNSQFSIENGVQYLYSFEVDSKKFNSQFVYQLEPRFYYRLRKDTRQGLAANNLSSMYIGFLNQWNISGANLSRRQNTYNYDLTWGMQLRYFDHLYGGFSMGIGLQDMINEVDDYPLFYDFRFGLAF